jgi:two-component system, OmpR family, phosphate regulon sensor histidine kinase PhoR
MFSNKDLTAQQLAAYTAALIALPIAIVILIFNKSWLVALCSLILIFLGCFALLVYILQNYIYKKIKLIYKFIYQTKASKREEFYYSDILPKKGIDEVRADVEKWAQQRNADVETLQQNEQYRKEFLQNVSHELKTPIFALQGYIETLLSTPISSEEVKQKFLNNSARNVDRLVNLVADLDEISKLEFGEQQLHFSGFYINELLDDVFTGLSIKAEEKNITYQFKKGAEQSAEVFADKQKIKQVVVNLMENAIKYGKENTAIEAGIYRVDGEKVLIEISDKGEGIAAEHLTRIFERFYRTDEARSRGIGGSGLGLSICKHIIEAHNETIHVRSKLNVGTTFGFTLAKKNP